MNTGERPMASSNGLLTTVGWRLGDGRAGDVRPRGLGVRRRGRRPVAARRAAGRPRRGRDRRASPTTVTDTGGVYLVPAFVGLGAPYWDAYARGTLVGLTRGTGLAEIARAAIDAMAYQVADVVGAMVADAGVPLDVLRVDGGAATNDRLCQFQADLLERPGRAAGPRRDDGDRGGDAGRARRRVLARPRRAGRRSARSTGGSSRRWSRRGATGSCHGWHRAVERSRELGRAGRLSRVGPGDRRAARPGARPTVPDPR